MAAIIIVNWNCWEDTARCIEACLKLDDFTGAIFVCDNGSTDSSVAKLQDWGLGHLEIKADTDAPEIVNLVQPAVHRPLALVAGSAEFVKNKIIKDGGIINKCVYLIILKLNLGFAGGNNIAIKAALADPSVDLFWLLNPDAVPDKKSLKALKKHCYKINTPIIAGSILLEYWKPGVIQACGATFSKLTLRVKHRLEGVLLKDSNSIEERIDVDYPVGASLIINRLFIQEYGFLDESYFLYFEEIDLCLRMNNVRPFIVTNSVVYHKGGASTGGGRSLKNSSLISDFYYLRGRLLLSRKLSLLSRIVVFSMLPIQLLKRLLISKKRFYNAVNAIADGINSFK